MSESSTRISRRTALKRIGTGAALAWSAPTLTTLGSSALAQTTPACAAPCSPYTCGVDPTNCGVSEGTGEPCFCNQSQLGNCECWATDTPCTDLQECDLGNNFACPPGTVCMSTCCDQEGGFELLCVPLCNTLPTAPIGGAPVTGIKTGWTTTGLKI